MSASYFYRDYTRCQVRVCTRVCSRVHVCASYGAALRMKVDDGNGEEESYAVVVMNKGSMLNVGMGLESHVCYVIKI